MASNADDMLDANLRSEILRLGTRYSLPNRCDKPPIANWPMRPQRSSWQANADNSRLKQLIETDRKRRWLLIVS